MNQARSMQNALISVFYKDGLDVLAKALNQLGINIYSTGGTPSRRFNGISKYFGWTSKNIASKSIWRNISSQIQ